MEKLTTKEKVQIALDRLDDGIRDFFQGDHYKEYLATMSKLHHYSARNCIADCTVNVTGGGAGGVQVAGGGTLYGSNLTVTTASKAAIRSDRGGVRWSFFVNGVELTETK